MLMRKEIYAILLSFFVILVLISLMTFNPADPSINVIGNGNTIHNLFGKIGAYIAGLLIGLFGLGAFWVPVIISIVIFHTFKKGHTKTFVAIVCGGLMLIIATGSLLQDTPAFDGEPADPGMICLPIKKMILDYTGEIGGTIILSLFFLVGFIMATGFSLFSFLKRSYQLVNAVIFLTLQTGISAIRKSLYAILTAFRHIKQRRQDKKQRKLMIKSNASPPKKKAKPKEEITVIPPKRKKPVKATAPPKQTIFDFIKDGDEYRMPPISFLNDPEKNPNSINQEHLRMQSELLQSKLEDFGVKGKVDTISPGPVITTFEYKPAPGIKINKVVNLSDDLALALRALSIRIVAPIPGKAAIGIEVPNATREYVCFKELVTSQEFEKSKSPLTLSIGFDIVGNPVVAELNKMPHLLIAGATGAGKSVGLNVMISSILYKATPDDVKLIMIDPKRIELSVYDGIPHLITPVVTDMKKATNALFWAVREMERRYKLLAEKKVRNILQYNKKVEKELKDSPPKKSEEKQSPADDEASEQVEEVAPEPLPYIVIIIDELADLMMVASRDVEVSLTRLAQMARAAGLHIILATQRPSVDVLTGIIKANFPTRISFQVSSKTDSRTILDTNGAENLLGSGDMLFLPPGTAKIQRIHGAFISEEELNLVIEFWKSQKPPEYDENILEAPKEQAGESEKEEHDEKYDDAVALVTKTGQASISMVQRHLRIGYNRAARIIEIMEKEGVVGPSDGVKPREVLVRGYDDMP